MPTVLRNFEHLEPTRTNQLRYQFTTKHHGGPRSKGQAQWLSSLTFEEEFSVFDDADAFGIVDVKGHMYGVVRDGIDDLRELGMWGEQMAKFPSTANGPWHGYPCWTIDKGGPSNRRKQSMFPPKRVFILMQANGLITEEQRDRLSRGDHA